MNKMKKRYAMVLGLALGAALVAGPAMAQDEEVIKPFPFTFENAGSNVSRDRFLYAAVMYAALLGVDELGAAIFFPPRQQSRLPGDELGFNGGFADGFARARGTGLSGGEHDEIRRISIWANGAYSNYEDTLSSTSMDGESWNATARTSCRT